MSIRFPFVAIFIGLSRLFGKNRRGWGIKAKGSWVDAPPSPSPRLAALILYRFDFYISHWAVALFPDGQHLLDQLITATGIAALQAQFILVYSWWGISPPMSNSLLTPNRCENGSRVRVFDIRCHTTSNRRRKPII